MNPCPCGFFGDPSRRCHCGSARIERYRQRISGPLLDRIDIRVQVPRLAGLEFTAMPASPERAAKAAEAAQAIAQVQQARSWRLQRSGCLSARLDASQIQRCCALPRSSRQLLERSAERLALSGRGIHRLLAVGRTIADLAGSESIEPPHLAEAVQLRRDCFGAYCANDTM